MKLSSLLLSAWYVKAADKPNVILLLADDLGMGDISLNNINGKIKTPNIDQIGLDGINFLDAHSSSTKCSPSRYMLMTGRFSFVEEKGSAAKRKLYPGTPHLADLFKRNGYRTGIVGKTAPIQDNFLGDLSKEERMESQRLYKEWRDTLGGGTGIRSSNEDKKSFWMPGNYTMSEGAHTMNYDYAFLNQYACCRVGGGFFENGIGTEPFTKFAIQKPYPEGSLQWRGPVCEEYKSFNGEDRCGFKSFANGYLGPPYFDERIDGPVLVPNLPPSILVQEGYDSRDIETRINQRALTFMRDSIKRGKEPFFLYYGFRAGHNPFNSAKKFRGTSNVGEIGEAILELDYMVGRVINTLKEYNVYDNTIIVFMSDNGAITRGNAVDSLLPYPDGSYLWDTYQHYQNSMTLDGVWHKFNGGKNSAYEGGHRMPFLWRYPKLIKPGTVDRQSVVSYTDVYRTLAEMIGDKDLPCNEAPDSRSLLDVLKGEKILNEPMLQHSVFQGTKTIRIGPWKLIQGSKELFNLDEDMQELNNRYDSEPEVVTRLSTKLDEMVNEVNTREARTEEGRNGLC